MKFSENDKHKVLTSERFNYVFNKVTGFTAMWGATKEEDPTLSPFGPMIADIEISTICNGIGYDMEHRHPCSFCYKTNTGCGKNMTLETFKIVFSKFPKTLTQIAFGIGDIDSNPDLLDILWHCRENGVIPNITINGMGLTPEWAMNLAHVCGAIAVSHYHIEDVCFDAVKLLCDVKELDTATLKQVNIHKLLSKETYKGCEDLIWKKANPSCEPRLEDLNAIVYLLLKPKGDRNKCHSIPNMQYYKDLVEYAREQKVQIGMDSCSAPLMLKTAECLNMEDVVPSVEACESGLFSIYIDVDGRVWPCSFCPDKIDFPLIDMTKVNNFIDDVWCSQQMKQWREGLLKSSQGCTSCKMSKHCRSCPVYKDITICK